MAYVDQIEVDGVVNELQDSTARQQIEELSEVAHSGDYNDLSNKPDLSGFITRSVNDLVNYYTKTETYTKTEVNNLVNAIKQFTYEVVATLPTASASTMYKIYLVPTTTTETQNIKDEYITIQSGSTYSWEQIGSTAVDLSGYSTTEQMNAAIANALTNYYTKTSIDEIVATLVSITDFNAFKQAAKSTYARKDGFYETLGAGSALNLAGNTPIESEYSFRPTAGASTDIGSGNAVLDRIKGNAVKWNQIINNGDFSLGDSAWIAESYRTITVSGGVMRCTSTSSSNANNGIIQSGREIIIGHKYLIRFEYRSSVNGGNNVFAAKYNGTGINITTSISTQWAKFSGIGLASSQGNGNFNITWSNLPKDEWFEVANIISIDLTAIFGEGNEPETVEEFEEWLDEHVGLRDYYPYDEGSLIPVRTSGLHTVGFNAYNNGSARVIGGKEYQITGTYTSLSQDGEAITPDTDGKFTPSKNGDVVVVGGGSDTCIHLVHSGAKDGEYEDYWDSTLPLPITSITGKLNGEGESVLVCPDGLKRAGDVYDEIKVENGVTKLIKRIGSVDLGTLAWGRGQYGTIYVFTASYVGKSSFINLLISIYINSGAINASALLDKHFRGNNPNSVPTIYIRDDSYTDAATFKTAMNGVILYYELETPQEYILDNFELPSVYRVDDFGTEEILPNSGDVLTALPTLKVTYNMNASDTIKNLPKNYVQREDVKHTMGNSEKFVLSQKGVNQNYAKKSGVENDLVSGSAKTLLGNTTTDKEFTSMVMDGADGLAKINEVKGKSLVWNQLVNITDGSYTAQGITFDRINGRISLSGTAATSYTYVIPIGDIISSHKYLIKGCPAGGSAATYNLRYSTNGFGETGDGIIVDGSKFNTFSIFLANGLVTDGLVFVPIVIDLTLMFGAGNEPSTVAEFEALFPLPYYEYNEGEIISNATEKLDVTGFNQWDEDWEMGSLNDQTGQETSTSLSLFRSKDFIPVLHGVTYYTYTDFGTPAYLDIYCYNQNKEYIGKFVCGNRSFTFGTTDYSATSTVTPSDTRVAFVRFRYYNANNNIGTKTNLNISDPNKNGTYEPYKHAEMPLNLNTITGKLNGEGESVTIFPDGMRSVGSVFDSLVADEDGFARKAIVRMGSVDSGTLTWYYTAPSSSYPFGFLTASIDNRARGGTNVLNAKYVTKIGFNNNKCTFGNTGGVGVYVIDDTYSDAATFKTAMNGVGLIYELAEYKEYVLDEPIPLTFQAYHNGVIRQDPQAPDSAPMAMDVTWALDAVATLQNLPQDYISAASMDAFLAQLGTAMNGTWTRTFNTTTGKHEFTFTPNA